MTKTVLLDLDNTLLGNDMNNFLPPYFTALHKRLRKFTGEQNLQQIAVASVQATQANQDPTVTNMAAFIAEFTQRIGHPLETLRPVLDAFYREDYPQLQQHTTFWPEARAVVRRLLADGYQVVIATNPLFPATAIEQRLQWAGVNGFPYALITSMENSHFSKPNPRYYQEILDKVKCPPDTTWMVGDNLENDIAPARTLGLKTWWITNNAHKPERQARPAYDRYGSLSDFLAWIESGRLFS